MIATGTPETSLEPELARTSASVRDYWDAHTLGFQ
jgi:hypothetical protein